MKDENGRIICDAHKIIFPGTNGDGWWDTQQLIAQVEEVIKIFDEAYPDCQALFIFNQSSAHALLPPDALRAFEMNKTNGGKQHQQKDTVIPQSNIDISKCGLLQKRTTSSGEA